MGINNYESFAHQLQNLLAKTEERLKNLSKKEALRLLEYSLKFPVEHEEVEEKLIVSEKCQDVIEFIRLINTVKNNMVICFIEENRDQLNRPNPEEQIVNEIKNAGNNEVK